VLVSSDDGYVIYDLTKQQVVETLINQAQARKKGTHTPSLIDVSHDD